MPAVNAQASRADLQAARAKLLAGLAAQALDLGLAALAAQLRQLAVGQAPPLAALAAAASIASMADDLSALRQIDAQLLCSTPGPAGRCVACGELIDSTRLASVPTTAWCARCKRNFLGRRGIVPA